MIRYICLGLLAATVLLSGCASTPPVQSFESDKNLIKSQKASMKIGIVTSKTPEISVSVPGASCLLCVAVAKAANGGITTHLKTLDSDVPKLDNILFEKLKGDGFNVSLVTEEFDFDNAEKLKVKEKQPRAARRDFRPFGQKHNITHVIVFDIRNHGVTRNYSSYIATSPPHASINGSAYMIDLKTNMYVWHYGFNEAINATGQWKTPPNYPELTNAYYSVVEKVKENIVEAFDFKDVK